ncbi:MAG: hypothetical protein K9J13_05625 [Saprospiraceae bacterium]|nr:hypothetical protein [Saprospiraceae bacterium]
MRKFNLDNIGNIDYHRKSFEKFKIQALPIIEEVQKTFNTFNIKTIEFKENSFSFTFWGLNFIVKPEISFNIDEVGFTIGELNTYLIIQGVEKSILSYKFDSLGNVESQYFPNEFSVYYYKDFIRKVIEYSNENNLKFQLK